MDLRLPASCSLFCAFVLALVVLPSAAAQPVLAPSSVERTLGANETASASLTLTNTGTDSLRFAVRLANEGASRSAAASGLPIRMAPYVSEAARLQPPPFVLAPGTRIATSARSPATDSLLYDDGDAFPDSFLGAGIQNVPLYIAQRFTAPSPFILDGLRFYVATDSLVSGSDNATDLSVGIEVYTAPDPDNPLAGTLLSVAEAGYQAGFEGFAEVSLPAPVDVAADESFFVVLTLLGPAFPAAFDLEGSDDAVGRSLAATALEEEAWVRTEDITGEAVSPFLIRALSGSAASSGFLSVAPASGTLAASASTELALSLSSSGLFAGTYQRTVEVIDLETGATATTEVTLTVTGEGIVTLSSSFVDLEEVLVGSAGGQALTVINEGTAPLTITGSSSTDPALEAFGLPVGEVLAPGTETFFAVRFAPTVPGPFSGTLTVTTDVGEASVDVVAVGVAAPQASVTPDVLETTLAPGATTSLPITIANAGGGQLSYSIAVQSGDDTPQGTEGGAALDSLFYDDGDAFPTAVFGLGEVGTPLFVAQRFTTDDAFALNAVRLFASTLPAGHGPPPDDSTFSPLALTVEVYDAPDPDDPTAGSLLSAASMVVNAPVSDFVSVSLGTPIELGAGTDFFVAVRYEGVAFPVGFDATGTGDSDGRGFFSLTGEAGDWSPVLDYFDAGTSSVPLIRALNVDASGLIVSLDAVGGEVAPGSEATVTVTVDATTAEPDTYTRTLVVFTNDPQQPTWDIPLTVVVEGAGGTALAEGWNLVSWNVDLPDATLEAALAEVWDEVEAVQVFRDQSWTSYDAAGASEADLHLQPGEAVWVKLRSAGWLPMEGAPMQMDGLDLDAGLNAVAYLPDFADLASHAFAGIAEASESVQSYHSTGVAYVPGVPAAFQTLGTVRPGMGYLVRTFGPVRLEYPLTAATAPFEGVPTEALVAAELEAGVTPTPAWVSVWGRGLSGLSAGTLVTAVDPDDVVSGAFSVRADGSLGLMAIYADDPATEADEGARPGDTVALRTEAGEFASIEWTEAGSVLEVTGQTVSNEGGAGVPAAFALRSTYPNPFAETASVAFDLAAAADVSLDVYDTTGRLVATLVRGPMAAGSHEATWEARGVASGIYLVALRAGDFLATRTVVLMR